MNATMVNESLKLPRHLGEILHLLEQTGSEPVVLRGIDRQKWVVVCPKLVGRVMCMSFAGAEGETRGFINRAQLQRGFCCHSKGAGQGNWNNFGGIERIWFTPEGGPFGFSFPPRETQDLKNYMIPAAMQEQPYRIVESSEDNKSVTFSAPIAMSNYQGHEVKLSIRRQITVLDECPFAAGLGQGIRYVGFESKTWATNAGERRLTRDTTPLGLWTLGIYQSGPHTVVLLPYRQGPEAELGPPVSTEYLRSFLVQGSLPAGQWATEDGCVVIRADGKAQSKLEMRRRRALGRLASLDLDTLSIDIVDFPIYPERPYPASCFLPYEGDPLDGGVLSSYMNEGEPGSVERPAIHELEVCSPLLELAPGEQFCHTSRVYQLQGNEAAIDQICQRFFNTSLKELKEFLRSGS
jgi:hypothetical protein